VVPAASREVADGSAPHREVPVSVSEFEDNYGYESFYYQGVEK
jgi:hypothetical protein